jgi:steroid 5-alpha reductase family enzyme
MTLEAVLFVLSLNLLGFAWCYIMQSDHLTDLIYSFSFLGLAALLFTQQASSFFHLILFFLIALWSIRLGLYLVYRVSVMGRDKRFDKMRKNWRRIGSFWLLQTISILVISLPLICVFDKDIDAIKTIHLFGFGLAILGLIIESIADFQKFRFRRNPNNKGLFIQSGLWKIVQHPNYSGEILFWCGIFVGCAAHLNAWEWLSIIGPLWIIILLVRISGIPILQKLAKKNYGHLNTFEPYRSSTPKLLPFLY